MMYSLVNVYITTENHHVFFLGQTTKNGPCSLAMLNNHRAMVIQHLLGSFGGIHPRLNVRNLLKLFQAIFEATPYVGR